MTEFDLLKRNSKAKDTHQIMEIKTLREAVYFYLRDAITKQEIKPKERLQDKTIAKQLGVSTTPVREAFLKLQAEGYIDFTAHRSVTVRSISHNELIEIYQVISVLDGYAASLALERMDKSTIAELRTLTNKMETLYKKEMIQDYLNINTLIHTLIWEVSGNSYLKAKLDNIQDQMLRYNTARLSFYSKPDVIRKSMRDHKRIFKAFKECDRDNIEIIVRNHWNIFGKSSR